MGHRKASCGSDRRIANRIMTPELRRLGEAMFAAGAKRRDVAAELGISLNTSYGHFPAALVSMLRSARCSDTPQRETPAQRASKPPAGRTQR